MNDGKEVIYNKIEHVWVDGAKITSYVLKILYYPGEK